MNEYYIKFKGGGFSYVYADEMVEEKRDYVFYKNDTSHGRVVAARYNKNDVEKIVTNPTFE